MWWKGSLPVAAAATLITLALRHFHQYFSRSSQSAAFIYFFKLKLFVQQQPLLRGFAKDNAVSFRQVL